MLISALAISPGALGPPLTADEIHREMGGRARVLAVGARALAPAAAAAGWTRELTNPNSNPVVSSRVNRVHAGARSTCTAMLRESTVNHVGAHPTRETPLERGFSLTAQAPNARAKWTAALTSA